MIENNPTNVVAAFEILLEEIEAEIDFITTAGAKGFKKRDFDRAKEALEHAPKLTDFRDKIASLRKEWETISALPGEQAGEVPRPVRKNLGRLQRGIRTREEAYYRPILQILSKIGGAGKVSKVIDKVGKLMKDILKKGDYEPLTSNPKNPRWRNTAQWARNSMVNEGLLRNDSPRGIWEITQRGYKFVSEPEKSAGEDVNMPSVSVATLFCKGKDAYAQGNYGNSGIIVFADSKCRAKETAAIPPAASMKRKELIRQGILVREGDSYKFTRNCTFSPKPSQSAQVILGRSANGWTEWKDRNGRTLQRILRNK